MGINYKGQNIRKQKYIFIYSIKQIFCVIQLVNVEQRIEWKLLITEHVSSYDALCWLR